MPFADAVAFVRSLNLKTSYDYALWSKSSKRPSTIPSTPARTYIKKGWRGMNHWLGIGSFKGDAAGHAALADRVRSFVALNHFAEVPAKQPLGNQIPAKHVLSNQAPTKHVLSNDVPTTQPLGIQVPAKQPLGSQIPAKHVLSNQASTKHVLSNDVSTTPPPTGPTSLRPRIGSGGTQSAEGMEHWIQCTGCEAWHGAFAPSYFLFLATFPFI